MKKGLIVILCILLLICIIGTLYVEIGKKHIEDRMWDYLKQEGYGEADIRSVKVRHSFMNIILSYREWMIEVVYEDEITSQYFYTVADGKIVTTGVSGTTNKEDLKH